jgi:MYXO-CTERM domain-containing protein
VIIGLVEDGGRTFSAWALVALAAAARRVKRDAGNF